MTKKENAPAGQAGADDLGTRASVTNTSIPHPEADSQDLPTVTATEVGNAFDAAVSVTRALDPELATRLRAAVAETQKQYWRDTGTLPPFELLSSDDILTRDWPEPTPVIPDVLYTGLAILAGRPKAGKSWLALQFALGVAAGGMVFDKRVDRGKVLYLALEDSPGRLKKRMLKQEWRAGLQADFMTLGEYGKQVGNLLKGGAEKIAAQIRANGYRLVVVDTLSRAIRGDQNDPDVMTASLEPLQEMAHKHDCAVLLIDHHRKPGGFDTVNAIDDILGSTAKSAMVDCALGLYKERGKAGAKLQVVGRESDEVTLALTFDPQYCFWKCEGDAYEIELTERRQEILDALASLGHAELKTIADTIGQPKSNTHNRLQDLVNAGLVIRVPGDRVTYKLP